MSAQDVKAGATATAPTDPADPAERPPNPAEQVRRALTPQIGDGLMRAFTLIGFAAMVVVFSVLKPDIFPTWVNIKSILDLSAPIVIVAIGLTAVLVVGEFDLSFSGLIGLVAVITVKAMSHSHQSTLVAVLLGLGVGLGGGIVTGLLVATQRASSFIITLALGSVWGGLALGLSGGGGSTIASVTDGYIEIAQKEVAGVRLTIVYAVVVALSVAALLRYTVFGREAAAVGNNQEAARLAGIRLGVTRVAAFAVLGVCSAIAAIILSSRTGQYSPDLASGMLIPPFVAAFFGTSVLMAGRFNVFGTVVGALFIATLQTGLIVMGLLEWVSSLIVGVALILILFIAAQSRRAAT
jgi:ribose/xylose/arabinose/galactoside ABC-type transport system permease subunit